MHCRSLCVLMDELQEMGMVVDDVLYGWRKNFQF